MITPYAAATPAPEEVIDVVRRRVYFDAEDEKEMDLHVFFRPKAEWSKLNAWSRLMAAWLKSAARDIESENPWHKLHTENYWVYYRKVGGRP